MKNLHITIADRVATYAKRDGAIICGNSDYKVIFTFDEEWSGVYKKTARFIWNGQYFDVEFAGTEVEAPIITNADSVEVGVYAGELRTTTGAVIPCKRSILCGTDSPNPGFGENYTTQAKAYADEAKAYADEAKESSKNAGKTLSSINFAYDLEYGILTLSYREDGELKQKTVDLPLESTIVNIEEAKNSSGQPILILTLASGNTTTVLLDDVFRGFVKTSSQTNALYATDEKGNDVMVALDSSHAMKANTVPMRNSSGALKVPRTPQMSTDATSKGYVDDTVIDALERVGETVYGIKAETDRRLEQLESATLKYTEDSSVAYEKVVPTNAAKYASVNKVGGMTYRDEETQTLRDTKVTELVSEGANLISFPYTYMSTHGANGTKEGITFATADDGTITLNGTAARDVAFELYRAENICKADGAFYLSGMFATGSLSTFFMALQQRDESDKFIDGVNVLNATSNGSRNLTKDATSTRIYIHIFAGATVTNAVFKPMLNRGTTALPYKPYRAEAVDTFPISAQLRSFLEQHGYGRGLDGGANIVDFERKIYSQNVREIIFTGNETWTYSTTQGGIYWCSKKSDTPEPHAKILPSYQLNSHFGHSVENKGASINPGWICRFYVCERFPTVEEWVAYVKEQYANDTPIRSVCVMAEPIEIDISAYLTDDNFIGVEGGGVIRAVNVGNYEQAAPTTISYVSMKGE